MYNWHKLVSLASYYLRAQTRYDVHSPFLGELVEGVFRNRGHKPIFDAIENQRAIYQNCEKRIKKSELGAGSQVLASAEVKISQLARSALAPAWQGRLYHHLTHHFKPSKILELGTCLGISTAYLFSGSPSSEMISIEGDEILASMAMRTLKTLFGTSAPAVCHGTFAAQLPEVLEKLAPIDLVLIDGDHTYASTLNYVHQITPFLSADAIIILHDIHWSSDMHDAWLEIKSSPTFNLALDIFVLGLLCRVPTMLSKKEFAYIPFPLKPWRLGLF